MEDILEVYTRPYDEKYPQLCLDEASKQLLAETRQPIPIKPGQARRFDFEYRREGNANLFMIFEPLAAKREVVVTDRRTKVDFAEIVRLLVEERYPDAEKIVLVMDNLNTHKPASLYEKFDPAHARRLIEKLEIHYTPKHGSWLNMAEIELSCLARQCLNRRISEQAHLHDEVRRWQQDRNAKARAVDWRFRTVDARIKLKRLYPILDET